MSHNLPILNFTVETTRANNCLLARPDRVLDHFHRTGRENDIRLPAPRPTQGPFTRRKWKWRRRRGRRRISARSPRPEIRRSGPLSIVQTNRVRFPLPANGPPPLLGATTAISSFLPQRLLLLPDDCLRGGYAPI